MDSGTRAGRLPATACSARSCRRLSRPRSSPSSSASTRPPCRSSANGCASSWPPRSSSASSLRPRWTRSPGRAPRCAVTSVRSRAAARPSTSWAPRPGSRNNSPPTAAPTPPPSRARARRCRGPARLDEVQSGDFPVADDPAGRLRRPCGTLTISRSEATRSTSTGLARRTAEQGVVAVRGRRMRVVVDPVGGARAGGRPALLLCNGIGAKLEAFDPFIRALPRDRDIIRFDVPGVGGSPTPAWPYRFGGLASLVAAMVRELGYDRVDVLGISGGGALAQQLAFQDPQLCRRLVLVSTATGALMVPPHPRVLRQI